MVEVFCCIVQLLWCGITQNLNYSSTPIGLKHCTRRNPLVTLTAARLVGKKSPQGHRDFQVLPEVICLQPNYLDPSPSKESVCGCIKNVNEFSEWMFCAVELKTDSCFQEKGLVLSDKTTRVYGTGHHVDG